MAIQTLTGQPTGALTRLQAAAYIGVSPSQLNRMAARGELPPARYISTRAPRWLLHELAAWLEARPTRSQRTHAA